MGFVRSCGVTHASREPAERLLGPRSVRRDSMTAPLGPILVATDFSAHARHAATRAARLAHDTRSALTLMHVLPAQPVTKVREWLGA
mmetsp:Transcript_90568/g.252139  ORF Transcript_90568/g.252139 Transcript_90568/m.252139 type:complete len:87 (-) Transcript_90568:9-269(-)